ncbi:MAG: glycosyltransferase, partial [Acidimicrobiales bacterium]
ASHRPGSCRLVGMARIANCIAHSIGTNEAVVTDSPLPAAPSVTILLPTHSERPFIRDCLASIQRQTYSNIVEVLVIDGGSTDGTRSIAASLGAPFRLVDNPGVTAAAAMNVGLAEASGDIVVRMDAHALYARNYVERCVAVLIETGADNVGGRMNPVGLTSFGRAVAAVTSTPACVGPGSFHHAENRTEVDTVFLGCWRRETLERLGGFDAEHLQWAGRRS